MNSRAQRNRLRTVVCGGGVIGCATAYYLAAKGVPTTLLESCSIAAAASGKSGGFLAKDWCDGSPMAALAHRSFALHAELATTLPDDYGYRRVDTYLVEGGSLAGPATPNPGLSWLDRRSRVHSTIGTTATSAQVDPGAFTHALAEGAEQHGAQIRTGNVRGVTTHPNGSVSGVNTDDAWVEADHVVFAMGPWTDRARDWASLPKISASKGHSIVLRPATALPPQALFVEYPVGENQSLSPEVIPRRNGEVYVCGLPGSEELPLNAAGVGSSDAATQVLKSICADLSSTLANARLTRSQACYRPIAADALPIIGPVPGLPGAFVSTAHNCWGILNAPASGEAMAELISEGATAHIDLAPFSATRSSLQLAGPVSPAASLSHR